MKTSEVIQVRYNTYPQIKTDTIQALRKIILRT